MPPPYIPITPNTSLFTHLSPLHTACRTHRAPPRMCGIIGIYRRDGSVNVELYEGLLMLQHRGQDSAGMVTTVRALVTPLVTGGG